MSLEGRNTIISVWYTCKGRWVNDDIQQEMAHFTGQYGRFKTKDLIDFEWLENE